MARVYVEPNGIAVSEEVFFERLYNSVMSARAVMLLRVQTMRASLEYAVTP